MKRTIAVLLVAVACVTSACKGKNEDTGEAPRDRPEAISPAERKLAGDACGDYVARLCACAATRPELADTCKLKRAKPEALALAIAVADDPSSTADTVAKARSEVQKIVARCIEEAAGLPALGCAER